MFCFRLSRHPFAALISSRQCHQRVCDSTDTLIGEISMSIHKQDGTAHPGSEGQAVTSLENAADQGPQNQEEELQALRAERTTLMDRLARQQAEFENARKRSQKAQAEYREYALADVAKSLLPVLDSLERALGHKKDAKDFSSRVE